MKPLNVTAVYCKSRTLQCTICDKYKKTLVQSNTRTNEDLHLKAVTLNAGSTQYKGTSLTQAFTYNAWLQKCAWRYQPHIFCFFQLNSVCRRTHRLLHKTAASLCAWGSPTATSTLLVQSLTVLPLPCSWRFVPHIHIHLPQNIFHVIKAGFKAICIVLGGQWPTGYHSSRWPERVRQPPLLQERDRHGLQHFWIG